MTIRRACLTWFVATAIVLSFRLLFRTLRIEFRIADQEANPFSRGTSKRFLYCIWHDSVPVPMFARRHPRTVALVSKHRDGSYLARGLKMIGVPAVRGSSKHGGVGAVREMLRSTHDKHIVVTPDGPRGPRRQMKTGPVFIASRLGKPIVPTAFSYSRFWCVRAGWTDLQIPKPFAKVYAVAGEPITIPPDADRNELDAYAMRVQDEMDRLAVYAESLIKTGGKARLADNSFRAGTWSSEAIVDCRVDTGSSPQTPPRQRACSPAARRSMA